MRCHLLLSIRHLVVVLCGCAAVVSAFAPPPAQQQRSAVASSKALHRRQQQEQPLRMAPKYDGSRWYPSSSDDGPEAGYPPINTLLRHGPKPWFTRVFQSEDYEQAVLKFMAGDKCDRSTAQGNMDAYLRNPQDWQFNRFEEQKRGVKYDYVTINATDVALVAVWSSVVLGFGGRAVYIAITGEGFVRDILVNPLVAMFQFVLFCFLSISF
jgi:hypothetical protein